MADTPDTAYRVLARKYRPQTFADLIGQDVMVRTLRNAFAADRIAHAFVMTGVRGVGKTTTARIIAKGLNCVGPDGKGGPTIEPCGQCGPCRAIAEGRHVDVLEYDAASNTQVDKMREILASLPYRPAESRYKIIIFDEVHMLSPGAFNALLKTLEEPPQHVKFIFATTEIRKVPVTILSRCQRFDLRRIEPEVMTSHLQGILAKENASVAPGALALIVRAAEGSVRDALSLLDQAIAHGAGETSADEVRAMLGLADRGRVLDLFDMILKGEAAAALSELSAQYANGADPVAVLRDLAEVTHWVSVIKITPGAAEDPTVAPDERARGLAMAQALPMRVLTRLWQMLLKALDEVGTAPNAMMAAEMAVIRLTHVADLPDPGQLLRRLSDGDPGRSAAPAAGHAPAPSRPAPRSAAEPTGSPATVVAVPSGGPARSSAIGTATAPARAPDTALARYPAFSDVLGLIRERDMTFLLAVEEYLRLAHYAPGRIEFEPAPGAPPSLASSLSERLQAWTGHRWAVSVVSAGGAPTIVEKRHAERDEAILRAQENPVVQAILAAFPKARVGSVRPVEAASSEGGAATDAELNDDGPGDDWDPFEQN